ncbi:2-oxo-4-hydroxy-4-carboxy-5-ureidoimidazoline decarboxylase [Bauldia litoralis]|uniref:2-oxo-4-hydroxy-4-carboxy-5-ureidoimidazoline decarboxylase n=1 Tax=Bauldia litoralis TaxID=665467 RepID=A0A1G6B0U4_9HYPH|nr:2-oxo-4-hydroxy-4-carboxy-5-ureidoimidazoline decarboxylase [Bauldia litoralis]SDB14202.1 2-oxo-4-hydroxy-4-carboxy-5-ureidoimidazoline decarboxylase [Bauldia litoralis]
MAAEPLPLETVNLMESDDFVATFGDIAEHSPWVAEEAAARRPFVSRDAMIAAFQAAIGEAGVDRQHELLRAHPDLAGLAAVAGDLTEDSTREQAGAGLDRLTREEFARFTALNERYRSRNGIPFILAVRGATKDDILAAFESRIENAPDVELVAALEQVCRIVRFRLEDRVAE